MCLLAWLATPCKVKEYNRDGGPGVKEVVEEILKAEEEAKR